jgi:hypothetical protein
MSRRQVHINQIETRSGLKGRSATQKVRTGLRQVGNSSWCARRGRCPADHMGGDMIESLWHRDMTQTSWVLIVSYRWEPGKAGGRIMVVQPRRTLANH